MNDPRDTHRRLHDLVDGVLPPAEEAALRDELRAQPALAREHDRVRAMHDLLNHSLDMDPPVDLTLKILKSVRTDRARRSRIFRVPNWAENTLVLGGAASLAAIVATGRALGAGWAAPWLGKLSVGAADAVGVAKAAAVDSQVSVAQMDWTVRLLGTLSGAGWKAIGSSADVLLVGGVMALVLTVVAGWALSRGGRFLKGGVGHAHLLG